MKNFICLFLLIGIILGTVGSSFGTTFVDQTDNIQEWIYFDDGKTGKINPYADVIGDSRIFDTTAVEISANTSEITIDIYTKFDGFETLSTASSPSSIDVTLADFFITTTTGSYGIKLDWDDTAAKVFSSGIYQLSASNSIISSQDFFSGTYMIPFAGVYNSSSGENEIPVGFANADWLTSVSLSTPSFGYSIVISDSTTINAMDLSSGYSFFFATAECGNDVIHGVVPEPGTMLLFGAGLLGFSAFTRRKE